MLSSILGRGPSGEWLGYLIAVSLRGAVLLSVIALAVWACRRRSAGLRHLLWALGMGALAGLTAVAWALPTWRVEGLPASGAWVSAMSGDGSAALVAPAGGAVAGAGQVAASTAAAAVARGTSGSELPLAPLLLGLWLAGALLLLVRHARSLLAARELVRAASPAADPRLRAALARVADRLGVRRSITLRLSPALRSPFTLGVRRPTVVLPEEAATWPDELLRSVLAHEVAHVKRHDCALQLGAELLRAIHWMNPLTWLALHRLGVERELACDDRVIAEGTRPSEYASHLLRLSRHASLEPATPRLGPAAATMVGSSGLGDRLVRLLDSRHSHALVGRRASVLAGLALLLLALPIACLSGDPPGDRHRLRLVYETSADRAEEVTQVIARRLDELDLDSVGVKRHGRRITVEIPRATEMQAESARQLLPMSGELRFVVVKRGGAYQDRLVSELAAEPGLKAAGATVEIVKFRPPGGGPAQLSRHLVAPREALERVLRELPPSLQPEPGHSFLLDPTAPGSARCRLLYVDDGQSLTLTRMASAEIVPWNAHGYEVRIDLGAEDGAKMETLTGANVGQRLAIQVHGRDVWGAPVIQSKFGRRVMVTMQGTAAEAERLAASFRAGALPAPVVLIEQDSSK